MDKIQEILAKIPGPASTHIQSEIMWFAPIQTASLEAIEVQLQGDSLHESMGFEYNLEREQDQYNFILHLYFTFDVPALATIVTCSSFKIFAWPHHFSQSDFLKATVNSCLQYGMQSFAQQLTKNGIAFTPLPVVTDNDSFFTDRLSFHLMIDPETKQRPTVYFQPSCVITGCITNASWLLVTFLVADEMLFHNPNIKKRKNRQAFNKIIPLTSYYTIRRLCLQNPLNKKILSIKQVIFLARILEFSMQILVGNYYHLIEEALTTKNFPPHLITESVTDMQEAYNNIKDGLNLPNNHRHPFAVKYKWDQILQ